MPNSQQSDKLVVQVKGRATPSYIITGRTLAIVDVCFPSDAKNILSLVNKTWGREIKDIDLITITHAHLDHINGMDYLVEKTQSRVAVYEKSQEFLSGRKFFHIPKIQKQLEFVWFMIKQRLPRPSIMELVSMTWSGVPGFRKGIHSGVDVLITDGQTLPGHEEWICIYTPGHTVDSVCFYNFQQKALITGDTILNLNGQLVLNHLLEQDPEALNESFQRLRQLSVEALYPGWGFPVYGSDLLSQVLANIPAG